MSFYLKAKIKSLKKFLLLFSLILDGTDIVYYRYFIITIDTIKV